MSGDAQLSIFETPAAPSRRGDPITSELAGASVDVPARRRAALEAIAAHRDGATYHDVVNAAGAGRLTELDRLGLIETHELRQGPTGRLARVWRVTPAGLEALR